MKKFDFTIRGNRYKVEIKDIEDNIATLDVNGTSFEVEIHKEVKTVKTPRLVRKEVKLKPGEGLIKKSDKGNAVKSPLPGNIFKINVSVGDNVKKGDVLLIMEAMKMENNVLAEKDGTIKEIKVKEGEAVLQNDVLLVLE
jgi:biotin carboxyl carrier protein